MRELRFQVVAPVLPKLVAELVALFAVLSIAVLTEPPPEEDVARPGVSTLGPQLVADLGRLEDDAPQEGDAREATLYTGAGS